MDIALKIALISLIGTVLGSGSITAIVNAIVSHKGKMAKQLTSIQTDVKNLEDKVDKNEAQRARTQILRFNDELYMGKIHTKEHFDEILAACDSYNKYCDTHPDFENMRTGLAQKRIQEVYKKCSKNHLFLDDPENKEEITK